MPRYALGDVRVRVRRVGPPGAYTRVSEVRGFGPVDFVLVPGIGMSVGVFERLAPRLLPYGSVYALDLPGFAGTPCRARDLDIVGYAHLVGAAVDALGLAAPVVIGHSMGAQVVTELSAGRPDLTRLVLVSPVVAPAQRSAVRVALAFALAASKEPVGVALLAVMSYLLTGLRPFFASMPRMIAFRLEQRISDVEADVLVLRGELDAVCPRGWTALIVSRARSARAVTIPGAAHSIVHRNAGEVARLCAEHAGLTHPSRASIPRARSRRSSRLSLLATVARAREFLAILCRDDVALARAKTSRMRVAIVSAEGMSSD